PIAVGGALIRTLVPIGTHFSAHFELHQGLAENRDGFSKKVGIMHSVLAQMLCKCDAKIGHFRVLLCDVLVLQRMEPESDLFCQDHPLFTPLLGTLTPIQWTPSAGSWAKSPSKCTPGGTGASSPRAASTATTPFKRWSPSS